MMASWAQRRTCRSERSVVSALGLFDEVGTVVGTTKRGCTPAPSSRSGSAGTAAALSVAEGDSCADEKTLPIREARCERAAGKTHWREQP